MTERGYPRPVGGGLHSFKKDIKVDGDCVEKVAVFEKVSQERYVEMAVAELKLSREEAEASYNDILLPRRATKGSAGYDFMAPCEFTLAPNESIKIPTGIRAKISEGWVLMLYPRSGLGIRFRLMLDNTVGVIDSDYYYSDNEGQIIAKLTNCTTEGKTLTVNKGTGFMQGVFTPFGITCDDDTDGVRNGGFGSTTIR